MNGIILEIYDFETKEIVELYLNTNLPQNEIIKIVNDKVKEKYSQRDLRDIDWQEKRPYHVKRRLGEYYSHFRIWGKDAEVIKTQIKAKEARGKNFYYLFATGRNEGKDVYREMGLPEIKRNVVLTPNIARNEKIDKFNLITLCNIILTFRLTPGLLNYFFNIYYENLLDYILELNQDHTYDRIYKGLLSLYKFETPNEALAAQEFLEYYNHMLDCGKDEEAKKEVRSTIFDKKFWALVAERKELNTGERRITDQDFMSAVNYQLKYFLPTKEICKLIDYERSHYSQRVETLFADKPHLLARYDNILTISSNTYHNNAGGDFEWNAKPKR